MLGPRTLGDLVAVVGHNVVRQGNAPRLEDPHGTFVVAYRQQLPGVADGRGVVPDGWFAEATGSAVDFGESGFGYGYQWWTYPQGTYGAQGIFGQGITLFPDKQVVFAYIGNWATASGGPERGQFLDLARKVAAEVR